MLTGPGRTSREKPCVAVRLSASLTPAVKEKLPAPTACPEIVPEPDRLKPAGREPDDTLQLYGGLPPLAARVYE
jgi:hypothetical protein